MKPLIQLTQTRAVSFLTPGTVKNLRSRFDGEHVLKFPGFLEPSLLKYSMKQLKRASFFDMEFKNIGSELNMKANVLDSMFLFFLNDPDLLRLLEDITGMGPLKSYTGRLYRFEPGKGHHDSWHQDTMDRRKLALSINLSEGAYKGGILQLREKKSKKMLAEMSNTGPGDALLFRLGTHLEHQLTPLEGRTAKTAYAGWFGGLRNQFWEYKKKACKKLAA